MLRTSTRATLASLATFALSAFACTPDASAPGGGAKDEAPKAGAAAPTAVPAASGGANSAPVASGEVAATGPGAELQKPETKRPTMSASQIISHAADFATGNNDFALRLYRSLPPKTNAVVSPASIELALAMTARGARGETVAQMRGAMGFAPTKELAAMSGAAQIHWAQQAEQSVAPGKPAQGEGEGEGQAPVELRIANRLYGEQTYTFVPDFLQAMGNNFDAPLASVDFRKDFEAQRSSINAWVAEQTKDKIRDLLPAGSLDALTTLVLVNAIYFYGPWATPFNESATRQAAFTVQGEGEVMVPTMFNTASYAQAKVDDLQLVELPYIGGKFVMTIAVPMGSKSVGDFIAETDGAKWSTLVEALEPARIELALPKFKVDPPAAVELKSVLEALGMPLAFDPMKADFTGMAKPAKPDEMLYISKVFHKAFIEVDEKGTEAAAATAVVMATRGRAPQPPQKLAIDRPFFFAVRERSSGLILFAGHVGDPRESS